ncbi:MAG: NUDIX hydrolase [Candidatus Saccharimonas sp.]
MRGWIGRTDRRMSSSAVAIYTANDEVVVVKAHYKNYWSFPGGVIDKGETPLEAAVREVSEEVGVSLQASKLSFTLVVSRVSSVAQTYQFVFETVVSPEIVKNIVKTSREITEVAVVKRSAILAKDRHYAQSVEAWAQGKSGYTEQIFGAGEIH